MDGLEAAIAKIELQIDKIQAEVETAVAQGRVDDARQLRTQKEQLRKKKEQLREKELIALRASGNHCCLKETVLCLTRNATSTKKSNSCYLLRQSDLFSSCNPSQAQPE